MSTRRLSQNQFIGLKRDLPKTFLEGATYLAVDTKQLYMYDENELPVLLTGTGEEVVITDLYGGNAVIRGGVVWIEDLDFYVWASEYIVDGIYYDDPVAGSVTLPTADATNPRIDLFVVNNDGVNAATVGYVSGVPEPSPLKPSLDLGTQVEVAFRVTNANETEPGEITKVTIYDENLGQTDEWDLETNSKVLPVYTTDPYRGTYNIIQSGDVEFIYTGASTVSITGSTDFIFAMKIGGLSTSTRSASLSFKFRNSSTGDESQAVTITNLLANKYNVNMNKIGAWQLGSIPMSEFRDLPGDFDQIVINTFGVTSMFWDWLHLQGGLASSGGTDIANGIESVVAGTGIAVDNTDPKNPVVSSTVTPSDPPTGLEALNEGNGIGYRIIGRNPDRFGNIGLGAFDFSISDANGNYGAIGQYCFAAAGNKMQIDGDTNVAFGALHQTIAGSYNSSNFITGYQNTAYPWSFANLVGGRDNITGTPGSTGGSNPVAWHCLNVGRANNLYAGSSSALIGAGLLHGGAFCTVVGAANVDITVNTTNQFWSPNNTVANPAFIVGIGDINTSSGSTVVTARRNGLVVLRNGLVTAPQMNNTEIGTDAQALITRNYGDTNYANPWTGLYSANIEVRQSTGELDSGTLVIGQDYVVDSLEAGDDFSNVGYVSDGTVFTATGTTPTSWANSTLVHDVAASQPVVTEHTNNTGLTFTWTWTYDDGVECNITGGSLTKTGTVINFSPLDTYSVTPSGYVFSTPTKILPLGATTGNFSSTYTGSIEVKTY